MVATAATLAMSDLKDMDGVARATELEWATGACITFAGAKAAAEPAKSARRARTLLNMVEFRVPTRSDVVENNFPKSFGFREKGSDPEFSPPQ